MHWLNFKRYKSDVARQAVPPHLNAAEFARHYADKPQTDTEEYLSLSGGDVLGCGGALCPPFRRAQQGEIQAAVADGVR